MSKVKYKLEVIVEIENDDWNAVGHDRVKKSVECAIKNALDDTYNNAGFTHPEAKHVSITPVSVEVI